MTNDFCTHPGAERLKAQIERYWRERGYEPPTVTLHAEDFTPAIRSTRAAYAIDRLAPVVDRAQLVRILTDVACSEASADAVTPEYVAQVQPTVGAAADAICASFTTRDEVIEGLAKEAETLAGSAINASNRWCGEDSLYDAADWLRSHKGSA